MTRRQQRKPKPTEDRLITIYVRPTGSDAVGTGDLANPYRTHDRARLDVPNVLPPHTRYVIDTQGCGPHEGWANFAFFNRTNGTVDGLRWTLFTMQWPSITYAAIIGQP